MNLFSYLRESRGLANTLKRLLAIASRFGVTSRRMENALRTFTAITRRYGCQPTLAATAVLLERYPGVFRRLSTEAELAVHGYVHTDYSLLDGEEQSQHMGQALKAFRAIGLQPDGFRAPYLRWNTASVQTAQHYRMTYGSNRCLHWDVLPAEGINPAARAAYEKGLLLYGSRPASQYPSLPSLVHGLLDIPASEPDDEAMVDRLALSPAERIAVWQAMLQATYERGELLTLILHHERVLLCADALEALLRQARLHRPGVWIAPLRDIADWWLRRSQLRLAIECIGEGCFQVVPPYSDGVAVLVRDAETQPAGSAWYGRWRLAPPGTFALHSWQVPVLSLSSRNDALRSYLEEEGFIVQGPDSGGLRIDGFDDFREEDKRPLLDYIEASDAALVRLARWPGGARSALSVTGDIDAMTLLDFLRRPLEV
ncbi:MAG TPA: polysaccharide deacetylase family protein [Dehalococcoidia bacterium]|nr:polysaccharide deacetylase family protein [Dehalococcoidia bacterium]